MTERQLRLLKPFDLLRLYNTKFHVKSIEYRGMNIVLHVIADRDWSDYEKHQKIKMPPEKYKYRTEVEVEKIPMPEIKRWSFDFTGEDVAEYIRSQRHLKILDSVSI